MARDQLNLQERVRAYQSPRRQWSLVVVMTLLTTCATIDRQVIALLATPIKADLQLTDTQLSLIVSAGFAITYVLFTLPAGYLVDRFNRKALAGVGLLIWSIMTMAGGFAGSFGRLLAIRTAVGVGESVITPCSLSMIRSALPPERRGRGFAIFAMQQLLGTSLAMVLGGVLIELAASKAFHSLPFFAQLRPWEAVLVLVGLAGLPMGALLALVREPPRLDDQKDGDDAAGYAAALRRLREGWRAYLPLLIYAMNVSLIGLTFGAWMPAMIGRAWGLSIGQIGVIVGSMMLVLPQIGLMAFGWLIDRLSLRYGARGPCFAGAVATTVVWLASWTMPLAPTVEVMWAIMAVSAIAGTTPVPIGPTLLARITPDRLMGKITGIQYFLMGAVASVLGPVIVGVISDRLFSGPKALAHSLSLVAFIYGIVAIISILICARTIPAFERSHG